MRARHGRRAFSLDRLPGSGRAVLGAVLLVSVLVARPAPRTLAAPVGSSGRSAPALHAGAAILEDLDTGQVLFEMGADVPRPVASLTKVMTALLVLERGEYLEGQVTVRSDAVEAGGTELGLVVGERISVRDLLYALLLPSANDAAVALADHVAGSEGAFVAMMNQRAAQLRLWGTRFDSATGLDDDGVSTARDVAALFRVAYRQAPFRDVIGTASYTIPSPDGSTRHIENRNELLDTYPGAVGGKTGYTLGAGHCLIAAARGRGDGTALLTVLLGEPEAAFAEGAALLDHGFVDFASSPLVEVGQAVGGFLVAGRLVLAASGAGVTRWIPVAGPDHARLVLHPFTGLALPIREGQLVATVSIELGEERVASTTAVAEAAVASAPSPSPPPGVAGGDGWIGTSFALVENLAQVMMARFL